MYILTEEMERIILYWEEREDIKISMEIYFNEKDQLIEAAEVEKLYSLLGIASPDRHSLLLEIKNRFEGNEAYSKFGDFMTKNNIDYKAFSWS